ncbi:hypothetical protein M3I54_34815 [Paraburkholderia sp. CNPSo 3274]|uniref:hypothetical protein n=1 Tax=unclassified Paraburkholderia TaxID=2615204 RepID=UPI0020B75286|nr:MULTISPECIES: hypothetical protein [unclassified Paraburkholderia]MCP3712065.1 hypothetical protein [Paraburkholderia sp. CNPSo 3274]MCP3719796.1 hypothetical protein [Paraburkholderia sp. CNPSo 3281]
MEGLSPLYRRVAGIDVHKMLHVVTAVIEHPDGTIALARRRCDVLFAMLRDGTFYEPKSAPTA